jgi:hypothetical protein
MRLERYLPIVEDSDFDDSRERPRLIHFAIVHWCCGVTNSAPRVGLFLVERVNGEHGHAPHAFPPARSALSLFACTSMRNW